MYRFRSHLIAATGLALVISLATSCPSSAQRNKGDDDGTGAGAGYSPPIDTPRGGAAKPDATAPMAAPPMPPDESGGQAAPAPEPTPPDAAAPDDATKKDDVPPVPD